MTLGAFALALATFGLAGIAVSIVVLALLRSMDRVAGHASPQAAAWLWRAAAFAPWPVALATVGAVFGLVPDHCLAHGAHHPHLCLAHAAAWPAVGVAWLAAAVAVRAAVASAVTAWRAWRSARVVRQLDSASARRDTNARRIPAAGSWAVTAGILRPRVFITETLATDVDQRVVLEHERLHATGRHALWQCAAALAGFLHVPGVAAALARRLTVAHEMAADEAAARAVGDRSRVAAVLVRLARQNRMAPAGAMAFGATSLETRVRALLGEARADISRQVAWMAALGVGAVMVAIGTHAAPLHHGLETLFGLFG